MQQPSTPQPAKSNAVLFRFIVLILGLPLTTLGFSPSGFAQEAEPTESEHPLKVSADLRVRAQGDYSDSDGEDRHSAQLRARLGATYTLNNLLKVGARIGTGSADDPNSTDISVSNWDDKLQISLDLLYIQLNVDRFTFYGGRIPQPFTRTDMVWDGDVTFQGIAATYNQPLPRSSTLYAHSLFFLIDEQAAGPESSMGGVQLGYNSPSTSPLTLALSSGYYHYSLGSMEGADPGDWRSNRLTSDGNYLSDYRLLDVIAGVTWRGTNPRMPVRLTGNYVRNLGAADDQNTGYSADIHVGRTEQPGDWGLTYGYSQTDVDAVLAAFSHDNISLPTNYKLHALTVDYAPLSKTMISAIWYHYRPNDPLYAGADDPADWLDRIRLAFLVTI